MEEEICYADLNLPSQPRSAEVRQPTQGSHVSKRLIQYKTSLWILGAFCVILGSALIVLTIFVFQSGFHKCETGDTNATKNGPGRFKIPETSHNSSENIAKHPCETFTEGAIPKICPASWIEEKGMCYWFSKDKTNWSMGYHDCSGKRAQMLVIRDKEEMTFIYRSIQESYPVWIGLNSTPSVKTWTWVDGTILNQTLIPLLPSENGAGCGVIKNKQVRSEMCYDEFRWICEKEAILC